MNTTGELVKQRAGAITDQMPGSNWDNTRHIRRWWRRIILRWITVQHRAGGSNVSQKEVKV